MKPHLREKPGQAGIGSGSPSPEGKYGPKPGPRISQDLEVPGGDSGLVYHDRYRRTASPGGDFA